MRLTILLCALLIAGCDTWPRYPRYALTAHPEVLTTGWDGHWIGALMPVIIDGTQAATPCTLDIVNGAVTGRAHDGAFAPANLDSVQSTFNQCGWRGAHVKLVYISDPETWHSVWLYSYSGCTMTNMAVCDSVGYRRYHDAEGVKVQPEWNWFCGCDCILPDGWTPNPHVSMPQ